MTDYFNGNISCRMTVSYSWSERALTKPVDVNLSVIRRKKDKKVDGNSNGDPLKIKSKLHTLHHSMVQIGVGFFLFPFLISIGLLG